MNIIRTQISGAYLVHRSRFCVKPVTIAGHMHSWVVTDAEWVSDNDVRAGHFAPIVAEFTYLENAFKFCQDVIDGKLRTRPINPVLRPVEVCTPAAKRATTEGGEAT